MKTHTKIKSRGELDVVACLSGRAIQASIAERQSYDDLTRALREAVSLGIGIDELSAESGLTPREIRRRLRMDSCFGRRERETSGILR